MIQVNYAEIEADALASSREREQQLLDQSIALMQRAIEQGPQSMAAVEAMHFTVRIWTHLLNDLAGPENELSDELRAGLISIGIWILREAEAVRQGDSDNIGEILDITRIIRDGLQ
ncbi:MULTISPECIES: flagellar biosynthesis regulator FlaF [unclassified Roseitalea]|uniref:flagellar biosynthesis regulator FlaF n=1 Tax=unclassified Roseitalea TaxID=2639107 RepID=UPI00273DE956|nr:MULTISPECIES: flagellar biosynthesis regulator FlaF [unclassified Roseitalea]